MFVYALGTQDVQLVRDLLTKEGVPKGAVCQAGGSRGPRLGGMMDKSG